MERRELYDPEDIESLLSERSYDELLEEERAYVLRHLSGREEYEAMRALLLDLRDPGRDVEPLVPDLEVRDRVMQVFRDQQQPRWRIWLNSIGPLVLPRDLSGLWRPALALGSLAVLVGAGIWLVNSTGGNKNAELAEVRKPEARPEQRVQEDADVQRALDSTSSESLRTTIEGPEQAKAEAMEPAVKYEPAEGGSATDVAAVVEDHRYSNSDATTKASMAEETTSVSPSGAVEVTSAAKADVDLVREAESGRSIGTHELSQNQSMANTGVKVQATKVRKRMAEAANSGRDLGQDQAILGLLAAGW